MISVGVLVIAATCVLLFLIDFTILVNAGFNCRNRGFGFRRMEDDAVSDTSSRPNCQSSIDQADNNSNVDSDAPDDIISRHPT